MSPANVRARFLRFCLLLLAACASCHGGDTCTTNGDCKSGELCAGPGQGPFRCYKDCRSSSCPVNTTCTSLTSADCPTCAEVTMACFPDSP